jgi:mRNA interferase MazF
VRRGEIWTVAGGPDYTGKPRPAIVLQDDAFAATASLTVCPLTTQSVDAPLIRLPIEPSERNRLRTPSHVMADRITTMSKKRLHEHLGRLSDEDMVRVNRAVVVFLGLAGPASKTRRTDCHPSCTTRTVRRVRGARHVDPTDRRSSSWPR